MAAANLKSVRQLMSIDVTREVMELIPSTVAAGILFVGKAGRFESVAGTSDLPHELDRLQMTFREGPCLEAALDEFIVRSDDFAAEHRWPRYSAAAGAWAVRATSRSSNTSMVSPSFTSL